MWSLGINIGIIEGYMGTYRVIKGYIGIVEKKMETTI